MTLISTCPTVYFNRVISYAPARKVLSKLSKRYKVQYCESINPRFNGRNKLHRDQTPNIIPLPIASHIFGKIINNTITVLNWWVQSRRCDNEVSNQLPVVIALNVHTAFMLQDFALFNATPLSFAVKLMTAIYLIHGLNYETLITIGKHKLPSNVD